MLYSAVSNISKSINAVLSSAVWSSSVLTSAGSRNAESNIPVLSRTISLCPCQIRHLPMYYCTARTGKHAFKQGSQKLSQ